jgi:hypothetical protein
MSRGNASMAVSGAALGGSVSADIMAATISVNASAAWGRQGEFYR